MNNILFDTQYGKNSQVIKDIATEANFLVYFGGSVDYSHLNRGKSIIIGNNVMVDLDEINEQTKSHTHEFLRDHLFISDRAFLSLPINKRCDNAYDTKYSFTGYRIADAKQIRDKEDAWYLEKNKHLLNCVINFSDFYKKREEEKFLFLNTDGAFLDIDTGIYPEVMPYSTTVSGAIEAGCSPKNIDNIIGIVRAYALYDGKGIMPTEFDEIKMPESTKRIGRLDLVALRDVCKANSVTSLILTDLCALDPWDKIEVCIGYKNFNYYPTNLEAAVPDYVVIDGWNSPTKEITKIHHLPIGARELIGLIESHCELMVDYIDLETSCIKRWDYWA